MRKTLGLSYLTAGVFASAFLLLAPYTVTTVVYNFGTFIGSSSVVGNAITMSNPVLMLTCLAALLATAVGTYAIFRGERGWAVTTIMFVFGVIAYGFVAGVSLRILIVMPMIGVLIFALLKLDRDKKIFDPDNYA